MSKYYIPIIGTISAGKTTFLKAFLGTEVLETGATTTTKFICLIKHSSKTSFYHVIPKKQNDGISFIKQGEEIKDINQIKKKIEEVNKSLSEKNGTKDDIFYMYETQIKNIKNQQLLDKCYFMDIPGLNEDKKNYIEDIFSLISLKDILFEIMIFDPTNIGSDGILKIFRKIEEKGCLKKENNLYILNKIDQITQDGEENIIDTFKKNFYDNFEDEKLTNQSSRISINFSKNFFIPMNSILYQAESKFNEDFYSMLLIELFYYINSTKNPEISSFLECLEKRVECIPSQNNIKMDTIENESENINGEEMEIIKKSFEDIKEIKPIINSSNDLNLGFNKFNSESKKILKKLFVIHKKKMYTNFIHTKSYNDLQEIINNITFNDNDLSSPPSILSTVMNNNFIINNNKKNNEVNYKSILDDMNCFIRDKLKNQFTSLNSYIQTLTENLYGRKIRVSLIGNISVGKSTVLNAIIGVNILPTKDSECTYRGVIIKHKNIDNFLLYRTKLKIIGKGAGYNEYYNFEEDPEPYCFGIENIKSYLKNKNSDQRIEDKDAFIVIQGRLKIFDFIKLDNSLIDKIEFIDLPGHDRQNNTFNSNRYYEKILKFSNSCIYINEAKSIDDEDSVARLKVQYISDKQKLYSNLQPKFINSCLFLINKADYVPKEEDRTKIKKSLIRIISQVEPNASSNIINISFFSAKYFNDFLFYSKVYVNIIENNPYNCLLYLYNKWSGDRWYFRNFKNYIVNKVSDQIEEKFDLDLDEDNISQIPLDFYNKLKTAFNKLYSKKHRGINSEEEDAVIKKLYCIYKELKNKDFSKTNYSKAFFDKLKEVILYSDKLQKENLNNSIEAFFKSTDELFNRELKKEMEEKRKKSEEKYYLFKDGIIPKINELINKKEEKIKDIISNTKKNCLEIMDDEIKNYESRIKDAEYEIKKAGEKLEKKIQKELEDMKQKQEEETKTLLNEILELSKELINAHYNAKSLSPSEMEEEKGETIRMVISIITSALSAIATTTGIILSSSVFAGMAVGAIATTIFTTLGGALMGGLGLLGGFAIGGLLIGLGIWYNRSKIKDQYKENLEKNKNDLIKKFDDILNDFSSDFRAFKDSLIKEMNIKVDVFYKNIDNIDTTEWENLKKEYNSKRDKTRAELKNLFK